MPFDIVTIEHGPHPEVLHQEAQTITFPLSLEDSQIIDVLKDTFMQLHGVGLAAPQIGIAKKLIVYGISQDAAAIREDAHPIPMTVLINPSYQPTTDAQIVYDWEGCFSVATHMGKVPRYDKIIYSAYLSNGDFITETVQGFQARVLQHEIDHVQGMLITDRLTADCIQGHPADMARLRYEDLTTEQLQVVQKLITEDSLSTTTHADRQATLLAAQQMIEDILKSRS